MSHWLDGAQLINACNAADLDGHALAIENAMELAACALADKLGIRADGIMEGEVAFEPMTEGQECPGEILFCDESSDWAESTIGEDGL